VKGPVRREFGLPRILRAWALAVPSLVSLGLTLLACGGGGGSGDTGPHGLASRPSLAPLAFPIDGPNPGNVALERAFPNLTFTRPIFLTYPPDGTNRIFVVEQAGNVWVFPNSDAVTTPTRYLDITGIVDDSSDEMGLLGFAFDPDYATNRYVYVKYTATSGAPRRTVVARYRTQAGNANLADPASASIILQVNQPNENHNAGMIAFGPDGYLYVSLGDGGSADDPGDNGQDPTTLLGSMLRIDVHSASPYAIPSDNPFVGMGGGVRGETWAYGFRNPWRWSFDRQTGDLWLGDVGQGGREEIDLVVRGGNYGWRVYEGNSSYINPQGLPASDFDAPVVDYGRSLGSTVIGGYVYRGQSVTTLRGAYVYADYATGNVWALTATGGVMSSNTLIESLYGISSFGEDQAAELYAVQLGGQIHRFVPAGGGQPPPPVPSLLSETGLFADTANLVPQAGLIPYDVSSPLWSDGGTKRRWLAVPDGQTIVFSPTSAWSFPLGTVLVKHFELEQIVGVPASARRLETRVLVREGAGWAGYTYRWNDAQTDATLLAGGETGDYVIQDPSAPGGVRTQTWPYPSRTDCLQCHTQAAGHVLGCRTEQLNHDHDYDGVVDNQLRALAYAGMFTTSIGPASQYASWPTPTDAAAGTLRDRARSYLATNCSMCHRPGAPAPGSMDFRYATPTSQTNVVNVRPTGGDLGLADPWRVRPFDRASSVLYLRMLRSDNLRMPPLAHNEADVAGSDVVGGWIDSGAP
jgi:uncharacterized repeat protein (TIGR03806 family)